MKLIAAPKGWSQLLMSPPATLWAALRPTNAPRKRVPNMPAITAPARGASAISSNRPLRLIVVLPFQRVEFIDADGIEIAEQHYQNRQSDGGFRGGHGDDHGDGGE